jgi:hypothetical protein
LIIDRIPAALADELGALLVSAATAEAGTPVCILPDGFGGGYAP